LLQRGGNHRPFRRCLRQAEPRMGNGRGHAEPRSVHIDADRCRLGLHRIPDCAVLSEEIQFITEIQRETGTTFLLSTHDRELAERCERRIYIQGGVVVDVPSAARVPLRVVPGDMVAVIDRTQTQATRDQRSIQANERSV
jgi:hypothetical protein